MTFPQDVLFHTRRTQGGEDRLQTTELRDFQQAEARLCRGDTKGCTWSERST